MATSNATFQELKDLTFALIGREYASTSAAFKRLVSLWNQGAKRAYRASNYWERYLVVGEERTVSGSEVSSSEGSKSNIDTFLRVYKQQPFEGNHVQECDFYVKGGSAKIMGSSSGASSVFVTYKKPLDVNLSETDELSTELPEEFMPYMAHYAAYTWQRSVEQNASENNFALSLSIVNQVLEDELAKIESQGVFNTNVARKFKTYRNT
jgi:hypothetical protein